MDNVTHTLAGVALGNAFYRERVGPPAVPILAIASNLPDIDAVMMLIGGPYAITMRRTFGHSLILLPVWILGAALLLRRRYPTVSRSDMLAMVTLGAVIHLLFDLVNSFGVVWLWPLSASRPELAIVFIIDLILTGILAAPLVVAWPKSRRHWLVPGCRLAVGATAAYFLICASCRTLAANQLKNSRVAAPGAWSYLFPEPLGPHRWRAVVRDGDRYRIFLVNNVTGRVESRGEVAVDDASPFVQHARITPEGRRLDAFFKAPVWTAAPTTDGGAEVRAYDLRFTSVVLRRGPGSGFRYRLLVHPDGRVEAAGRPKS